jgi:hypothetical protein
MPTRTELQLELQGIMRALDETMQEIHGERIGVTLFVFELGKDGGTNLAYVSNAEIPAMIQTVKGWLAMVESGMTSEPR